MSDQSSLEAKSLGASTTSCPVCGTETDPPFIHIASQPVHCNVLWESADRARTAPRGDLALVFCGTCGHVHNSRFDHTLTTYGGTYENSLHHSGVFQLYAADLATDLVERYRLDNRSIVEIGAGQGNFLEAVCAAGNNHGTGFDPSHVGPEQVSDTVRMVRDFYSEEFCDYPVDLIICRHVLEHIGAAGDFVSGVRRVIGGRRTPTFFEVPNALWTFRDGGVWDLIYEHCGYFTPSSLSEVFRRAGFDVERTQSVFGEQFLTIDARPCDDIAPASAGLDGDVAGLRRLVAEFAGTYRAEVDRWRQELSALSASGSRVVVWGAGSKGVSFLNTVDESGVIDYTVDVNPRKRGMYVSGTGQRIVSPDELRDAEPDVVIVMNPNYRDEIASTLADLSVGSDVVAVGQPT